MSITPFLVLPHASTLRQAQCDKVSVTGNGLDFLRTDGLRFTVRFRSDGFFYTWNFNFVLGIGILLLASPQKVTKRLVLGNSTTHLMNDAKISKLATLKQLKFLRFLIVVGPSLKFP